MLCNSQVYGKISLCEGCRTDLPIIEFACHSCALAMESDNEGSLCGQCINQQYTNQLSVDYAMSLYHYATPVDYLIKQIKFHQNLSVTAVLADLLKTHIETNGLEHDLPEAILPVPLHKNRLVKRGFNQALEIIKPLAKAQNILLLLGVIERSKDTLEQTNLNRQDRLKNISGSFTLLKKPAHSHIVIVDDVVTTGATTNELAKLLKQAGVEKVGVWSLARAYLK